MPFGAPLTRRAALKTSVAALAAAAVGATAPPPGIIDTHQHLWDLTRFKLPWLAHDALLDRNYLMADYLAAVEGLGVRQAVYMEVAVVAEQRAEEGRWVESILDGRSGPTTAAVLGGDPADGGFRKYVEAFKGDQRIKGLRCGLPADAASNPVFVGNVRYLGEIGWRFDLLPDPTRLADAAKLVAACPGTQFILDHCGNASTGFNRDDMKARRATWEDGLGALADQKNVVCKISGVCEAGPAALATIDHAAPIVDRCLDRFGADRVMFSGNWPVCLKAQPLKAWVEMLHEIAKPRGEAFGRKLFHDNAAAFYELK